MVHRHATNVRRRHRIVLTTTTIFRHIARDQVAGIAINIELGIDQISLCLRGVCTRADAMVMDQQHACSQNGNHGKSPNLPESGQEASNANVFDYSDCNKEERVDLMLTSFGIMLKKPCPAEVASGPYFRVTPNREEESRQNE